MDPKVQYRVHKSPPLVPILSHINPIHSIPSYLSNISDQLLLIDLNVYMLRCKPTCWNEKPSFDRVLFQIYNEPKKLRGFSPQANYTDRAIAAGQRS
jgi:hypothetical protein